MGSVFTLLFAPTFLFLLHYAAFKVVVLIYIFLFILYFLYVYFTKRTSNGLISPSVYIGLLTFAYFYSEFEAIKVIPAIISALFFILFLEAYINKKELVLSFTRKLYSKELSNAEIIYLSKSDGYWSLITLLNTLVQMSLVFYDNNIVWAFYSSIGWYIYFFVALIGQIIYGKLYAIKLSPK